MEPDVIDLKIGFDNGSIRVQISEYDNFEQVISGLRGLGSEEYLRALWESLKEADASIGDGGQGYSSAVAAEEIGTGGRVDIYDLIHDYVWTDEE